MVNFIVEVDDFYGATVMTRFQTIPVYHGFYNVLKVRLKNPRRVGWTKKTLDSITVHPKGFLVDAFYIYLRQ